MTLRIKSTAITLNLIGWLQVAGGVAGLGVMAYLMLQTETINGAVLLILLIGLGLFSYSIHVGVRVLTDEKKETAIILSLINQVLQIFHWRMLGYGLSYGSGAVFTVGIEGLELKFNIEFASSFNMAINSDNEFFFKVNLVAMLVAFVLSDILNELRTKKGETIENPELQVDETRTEAQEKP